jgi:hypothetical protein
LDKLLAFCFSPSPIGNAVWFFSLCPTVRIRVQDTQASHTFVHPGPGHPQTPYLACPRHSRNHLHTHDCPHKATILL